MDLRQVAPTTWYIILVWGGPVFVGSVLFVISEYIKSRRPRPARPTQHGPAGGKMGTRIRKRALRLRAARSSAAAQSAAVDALSETIKSLKTLTYWAFSIVLGVYLLGFAAPSAPFKVFDVSVVKEKAPCIVGTLYVLLFISIAFILSNLGDLLVLLDRDRFITALFTLAFSEWVMNPFAYFTANRSSEFASWVGVWLSQLLLFFSITSLYRIADKELGVSLSVMLFIYISIFIVYVYYRRVWRVIVKRLRINNVRNRRASKCLWNYGDSSFEIAEYRIKIAKFRIKIARVGRSNIEKVDIYNLLAIALAGFISLLLVIYP